MAARMARVFAVVMPLVGLALPIAGWLWLASDDGRLALREKLLETVHGSIQGTLAIGDLHVGPGLSAKATDVSLHAPDGTEASAAREVRLALDVWGLASGRIQVMVVADGALVDLSPDGEGKPALLRAVAPDEETVEEQKKEGGPRFEVDIVLKDGRVVRRAYVDPKIAGTPEGGGEAETPDGRDVDLEAIDLAVAIRGSGGTVGITIDGVADLVEPAPRKVVLHAGITKAGDVTSIDVLRVGAGRSLLVLREVAWSGDVSSLSAILAVRLDPEEVAIFSPERRPKAPISLHAAVGPVEGALVGAATLKVEGGGTMAADFRRTADGAVASTATLDDIAPPAWGLPALPSGRIGAVAGIAMAADGRIAARLDAVPTRLGHAVLDALAVEVSREGETGDAKIDAERVLTVRLEKFAARDRQGKWRLLAPATIVKDGAIVTIAPIRVHGPWKQKVSVAGQWPPTPKKPLVVVADNLAMHGLPGDLSPAARGLAGFLDVHLRLEDSPEKTKSPEGWASLRWRQASWNTTGPYDVIANATLRGGRATIALDATSWKGERLRMQADAPMRVPGARDHVSVTASLSKVHSRGLRDVTGVLEAGLEHGRTWMVVNARSGDEVFLRAAATSEEDWAKLKGRGAAALLASVPSFALTIGQLDLQALAAAGVMPDSTEGTLSALVTGSRGELHAHVAVNEARIAQVRDVSFSVSAEKKAGSLRLSTLVRDVKGGEAAIGALAAFEPGMKRLLAKDLSALDWKVRGSVADLSIGEATGQDATPRALRDTPSITGRLDAAVAIAGRGVDPAGWLYGRTADLAFKGHEFGRILVASWMAKEGIAAWVGTQPESGGRLAAVARLSGDPTKWRTTPGAWKRAPLFAAAAAEDLQLSPYAVFIDKVQRMSGNLDARAVVRGTAEKPDPYARLALTDGMVQSPDTGRIESIAVRASGSTKKIVVEELVARGGGGRGRIQGNAVAVRAKGNDWKLNGVIAARRFQIRGERFSGVVDGDAKVAGRLEYPRLDAEVTIASGVIELPEENKKKVQPLGDHPDFVVWTGEPGDGDVRPVSGVEKRPEPMETLRANLRLRAPRDLWIKGKDVNVELKANLLVKTGDDDPTIEGDVEAIRGKAAVLGKEFVVDHARVNFIGGTYKEARLDIRATHTMEDVEKTRVFANVTGSVAEPDLELQSDPPLPENAVASLLVFGHADPRSKPDAEQPNLAGRAATLVGNYLTDQLRGEVQEVVPIDVLELETGSSGTSAEGRLRVGKYIAPGLFLSYAHAFGAAEDEGANSLRLEYRFHQAWYLISEYSDGSRGNVDLVWTREF